MVVDLDLKESAPREIVVQRSDAAPRTLPTVRGSGRQRIFKLDPTKSLGSETVSVAAGAFSTQHYQDTNPRGGTIDIWASTQVAPFGLVKMERSPGANARRAAFGKVTYALARMGTGAKASITKPARSLTIIPDAMPARLAQTIQTIGGRKAITDRDHRREAW